MQVKVSNSKTSVLAQVKVRNANFYFLLLAALLAGWIVLALPGFIRTLADLVSRVSPSAVSSPRDLEKLTWNVWSERYSPTPQFDPIQKLVVNRKYLFVVDLAAFPYSSDIYTHTASDSLVKWLASTTSRAIGLDVLIIPDDNYFQPQSDAERVQSISVHVQEMRRTMAAGVTLTRPPFEELQSNPNAAFSFGRVKFTVVTKGQIGRGAVAFSVWTASESGNESEMFPIDELSVPVCIVSSDDAPCPPGPTPEAVGLKGPQLGALDSRKDLRTFPDAALQFVELNSKAVYGVFRCNSCSDWAKHEFHTWRLANDVADLAKYLSKTLNESFESASENGDSAQFRRTGEALYRRLFANTPGQQSIAEKKFLAFVSQYAPHAEPASVFVRMLQNRGVQQSLVPLGLMSIPAPSTSGFLGLTFIIDSPLEIQDYAAGSSCISRWTFLVPPDTVSDSEMQDARSLFSPRMNSFLQGSPSAKVYDDVPAFANWIAPSTRKIEASSALVIVSHHENDQLFFDGSHKTPSVLSENITRVFEAPSVAIINACGTAAPGAFDFVKKLNEHGVNAVIATATTVNSKMSGHFLSVLMELMQDHSSDPRYTLRRARFDAVKRLAGDTTYGTRALIYSLIGNGDVRLCPSPTGK
jgi:hypothetical protein